MTFFAPLMRSAMMDEFCGATSASFAPVITSVGQLICGSRSYASNSAIAFIRCANATESIGRSRREERVVRTGYHQRRAIDLRQPIVRVELGHRLHPMRERDRVDRTIAARRARRSHRLSPASGN